MELQNKDILKASQFDRSELDLIFDTARDMDKMLEGKMGLSPLRGQVVASLFYEPSTRTRLSFESAINRLGGSVITVSDALSSSLKKGETIEDNARILSLYSDLIVMRHPEPGSVEKTAKVVDIPVINAGDGANEHPTQSLLDLYTILKEKGRIDNISVSIVGDLKYGRTTHSLVRLLSLYEGVSFRFISPKELSMPKKIKDYLDEKNIDYTETDEYIEGLKGADILYVTRIQKERFVDLHEYEKLKDRFILTKDMLKNEGVKSDITIMHPLPRVNEVDEGVDKLSNAAFFRQAGNGLPIRMALVYLLLRK